MAAPLKKLCKLSLRSKYLQIYYPVRHKYWEFGEDSIHAKGENVYDRMHGVKKRERPHPETQVKGQFEIDPPKGKIYDKKPFPALLKKNKLYKWCSCGFSKDQPFCDGQHKVIYRALLGRTGPEVPLHEPVKFKVPEDGQYWICNCKQTNNRPFCDGTHKQQAIQDAIKK